MIYYVTVCFRHSNLEIKIKYADIKFSPNFFIEKWRILSSCPSRFRFRTSPYCLMVVLLPSWGKNKCRALYKENTFKCLLIHWGRVTHICIGNLTITGSDNGLLPDWCQAIIWINPWMLLIGPSGTNFSEILIKILTFSFTKMCLNVPFVKWGPICLGLSVLNGIYFVLASVHSQNWFDTVSSFSLTHNIFQSHFPTRILSISPNLSISSRGSGIFDLLSWTHKVGHITQVSAILAPFLSSRFNLMDTLRTLENYTWVYNVPHKFTKLCFIWEGFYSPHVTQFQNCRPKDVNHGWIKLI